MNILFLTQTKTLELFYETLRAMRQRTEVGRVGFFVAGGHFFDEYRQKNPEIETGGYELLKEWEILQQANAQKRPNLERLEEYEAKYGDPSLWSAAVSDRRIFLGKHGAATQDYRCRLSHERIQSILEVTVREMEALFDRLKPDLVVGFISVTAGEYIASRIAEARKIPLVNLRPARIKNYFYGGEDVHEPPRFLPGEYERMLKDPNSRGRDSWRHAKEILDNIRDPNRRMYEGAPLASVPRQEAAAPPKKAPLPVRALGLLRKQIRDHLKFSRGPFRGDHQYMGFFFPLWFYKFLRPLRIRQLNRWHARRAPADAPGSGNYGYVYFPMHKEPEVSLLVHGPFCLNQVEVVRKIARSLPVGMKLVVKDHPAGLGYHPLSFYEKIAQVPNVVLVSPHTNNRALIQSAKMVVVISGSAGLEALMLHKPVIALANAPFRFLPRSMVRSVRDFSSLAGEMRDLMSNYSHNEDAMLAYIAAVEENSVGIDFYSTLLERPEFYTGFKAPLSALQEKQFGDLAAYLISRFHFIRNAQSAGNAPGAYKIRSI